MSFRAYLCKLNPKKSQVIIYGELNKISQKLVNSKDLNVVVRGYGPLKNLVVIGNKKRINKLIKKVNCDLLS